MSIDRRSFLGLINSFAVSASLGATERANATHLVKKRGPSCDIWGFSIKGPSSVIGMIVGCDRWPNQAACTVAKMQVEERGRERFRVAFQTLNLQNARPFPTADWALIAACGDDPQKLDAAPRLAKLYQASGVKAVVLAMRDPEAVWLASSLRNEPKLGEALPGFDSLAPGVSDAQPTFEMVTLDPLFDLLRMCERLSRFSEGLVGVDLDLENALMSSRRYGLTAEAGAGGTHRAFVAADFVMDDIAKMAGARWLDQQLDMVVWVRLPGGGSPLRELRSVIQRIRARAVQLGNLRDVGFGHVEADDGPFLTARVLLAPVTSSSSQTSAN